MPFAYLSGNRGLYHLDFKVTPDTLIPRPETELLIDIALDLFIDKNQDYRLLDWAQVAALLQPLWLIKILIGKLQLQTFLKQL